MTLRLWVTFQRRDQTVVLFWPADRPSWTQFVPPGPGPQETSRHGGPRSGDRRLQGASGPGVHERSSCPSGVRSGANQPGYWIFRVLRRVRDEGRPPRCVMTPPFPHRSSVVA